MAKYFLDTEFIEEPGTIQLISIGVVTDDGREYYAQSTTTNLSTVNPWVRENVLPKLKPYGDPCWKTKGQIRAELVAFFAGDPAPEVYGWYADYDWVIFCWTFAGKMSDLPEYMPKYCRDIKQIIDEMGVSKEEIGAPVSPPEYEHNALGDAWWNKAMYERIVQYGQDHRFDI